MTVNKFRLNAKLDGFELPSMVQVLNGKKIEKKEISYAQKYMGSIVPVIQKKKKENKQNEINQRNEAKKENYKHFQPYQEAFQKLDKQTVIIDGKEISCMELFFNKCINSLILEVNDPRSRGAKFRMKDYESPKDYILDILTEIRPTFEAIRDQKAPELEEVSK